MKADAAVKAAQDAEREQFELLISTVPTTLAGVRAVLAHVASTPHAYLDEYEARDLLQSAVAALDRLAA